MLTPQGGRLAFPPPPPGAVFVNDRVSCRTEGTERVISVHGVIFAHYDVGDRVAEVYAMVSLIESGYATQCDVARTLGYSTRSVRRYQQRFQAGGLTALVRAPGRPHGTDADASRTQRRDERRRDRRRDDQRNSWTF